MSRGDSADARSETAESWLVGTNYLTHSICLVIQAAALAEFRADWSTAVKTYQTAYSQVQKVPLGAVLPYQHWHELTAVAEQIHIKVSGLLLLASYATRLSMWFWF